MEAIAWSAPAGARLRVVGAAEYLALTGAVRHAACDGLTLHPLLDKGWPRSCSSPTACRWCSCGEVDMAVVHGGWRGILGGVVQQAGRA